MATITKEFIEACFELADNEHAKISEREVELYGLTSRRVKAFLNNLCAKPNTKYLEIGVYKGSTIISAMFGNPTLTAIGIDDFSYDDREPKKRAPEGTIWENVKSQLASNIERYKDIDSGVNTDNLTIIESSWRSLAWEDIKNVNVCFIDLTPVTKEVYTNLLPKVIESMSSEGVLVFSQYSDLDIAKSIDSTLEELKDLIEITSRHVRVSNGLSDATKYYSGLLVVGIKKVKTTSKTSSTKK